MRGRGSGCGRARLSACGDVHAIHVHVPRLPELAHPLGVGEIGQVHDLQAAASVGHVGQGAGDDYPTGQPRRVVSPQLTLESAHGDVAFGGQAVEPGQIGEAGVPLGAVVLAPADHAGATGRIEALFGQVEVLGLHAVAIGRGVQHGAGQGQARGQAVYGAAPYVPALGAVHVAEGVPAAQVYLVVAFQPFRHLEAPALPIHARPDINQGCLPPGAVVEGLYFQLRERARVDVHVVHQPVKAVR